MTHKIFYSPISSGELTNPNPYLQGILEDTLAMVNGGIFPCSGAKAAFKSHSIGLIATDAKMLTPGIGETVWASIAKWLTEDSNAESFYSRTITSPANLHLRSTILAFPNESFGCEHHAEHSLWKFLKCLHEVDKTRYEWDKRSSNFVYSPDFGFSLCGMAHFVPMLHNMASSLVRRTKKGVYVVFNPHWMFRDLRGAGLFEGFKKGIDHSIERVQHGWINPKLADYDGISPESPQYALTINETFDIGACPFTEQIRPSNSPTWDMSQYPSQIKVLGTK